MPIGGKDAFLSKVTFRRESKWYSKTKQELKDMATIEKRANLAAWQIFEEIGLSRHYVDRVAEIIAEKMREQKAIDIDKTCEWLKENARDYACATIRCPYGEEEEIICDVHREIVEDFRKAMQE